MVADDTTHVSGKLTPEQIGEAIRHKKFGVDMRETIAQGFEYMLSWWELVQKLDKELSDLSNKHNADIDSLQREISYFKKEYDDQVGLFQKALSDHWTAISKNASDINNLGVDLQNHLDQDKKDKGGIDARLKKLEDAVFGYGEYEINYETPKTIDHVFEINTDSNPKLKGE